MEAGVRDGPAVPARAAAELGSSALGVASLGVFPERWPTRTSSRLLGTSRRGGIGLSEALRRCVAIWSEGWALRAAGLGETATPPIRRLQRHHEHRGDTLRTRSTTPDTIVLIHGLWVTPRSWEHWVEVADYALEWALSPVKESTAAGATGRAV